MLLHRRALQSSLAAVAAFARPALTTADVTSIANPRSDSTVLEHLPRLFASFNTPAGICDTERPPRYSKAGRVAGRYFLERSPVFAVVEIGPTQFKVSVDDLVYTEKVRGVDVDDKIALHRVLMLGSRYETVIGRPFIPGASVIAAVEVGALQRLGQHVRQLLHRTAAIHPAAVRRSKPRMQR